ncbi:MAG: hypothetical protein N3A69_00420 [Leptospiraceae bacterium]|nr:hypothetical protein [Leptospiraceae bacterium]
MTTKKKTAKKKSPKLNGKKRKFTIPKAPESKVIAIKKSGVVLETTKDSGA